MGKTVMLVLSHPQRKSLNGALFDVAKETLTTLGHTVLVSDLHQMNFNPIRGPDDVVGFPREEFGFRQVKQAYEEGRLAPDITAEQAKLKQADLVIFQFPMMFRTYPAMLAGWLERVCCQPFAYSLPNNTMEAGNLKGRKAMISFTTGAPEEAWSPTSRNGDIDIPLSSIQNTIATFGFEILAPHIIYDVDNMKDGAQCLAAWAKRLEGIFEEGHIPFFHKGDFDGLHLKQSVIDELRKQERGPTVLQHLGMPMPIKSMRTPKETLVE